ncbi:hypothetical protein [Agarivorans sp. B2Z047]|uniref:hypothetical protein n=1 Tax=Agarivorans sp. B2Z047 TaxID=2652721 RepID=UPI001D1447F3|nr:hypothetical protein [Agarivorans sp. B2Z047]UQN45186.1 hypothetical protein LQZ07_12200 [Agarivorans sp. B2Z047]
MRMILTTTLLLLSTYVFALEDYKCKVTSAFQVGTNGQRVENVLASMVGSEFTVDRSTGLMVGSLKNSYVTSPKILDFGSSENAFKAITVMKNDLTSNVYVLVVEEYIEDANKPFVFTNNSDIYYGTCTHF